MVTERLFGQKLNLSQLSGLLAALLVLLTGVLISLLTWSHLHEQFSLRLQQDAQRQLQRLTVAIAPSLLQQDRVSMNLTLQEWVRGPELDAIRVFNNSQQIIAESGRSAPGRSEISQPITQDNLSIGILRADLNLTPAEQTAARYLSLGLIATAFCALLAGLIIYAVAERYLGYLRQLQQRINEWQTQDNAVLQLPPTPALTDLQELHQTLEQMARKQQQQRALEEALGRFSAGAAPSPSARMQYHDCAMLFIEIQDLEVLQARLTAEQLSDSLNRYHRLLSQAAKLYNGKLDRYVGNGIVMLFGMNGHQSAEERSHHARHCLYAAQLFLGLIRQLTALDKQTPLIEFRLAAHWGPVLLAPLQANDAPVHCDLIGDTLHWAAHLASTGSEQQLLVSQSLMEHIDNRDDLQWLEGPLVSDLHGREQVTWWLQQLEEKHQLLINRQIKHITAMTENA